jgi:hypothetical protein
VLDRLRARIAAKADEQEREQVFADLDVALARASDQRSHARVALAQPIAELLTEQEYARWRARHARKLAPVIIPEPRPGHHAVVLYVLPPARVDQWLRGGDVKLIASAPLMVFPRGPEGADAALAAACTHWLTEFGAGYALAPPMMRRFAGEGFELADLGRDWPGSRARAADQRLADRPLRRRD